MHSRSSSRSAPTDKKEDNPSNEKELFYSSSAKAIFAEDDPGTVINKKSRKDVAVLTDFENAKDKIKDWIISKILRTEKNLNVTSWITLWGEKFTLGLNDNPGMKNVGKVIGEEYIIGEALADANNTQLALYRIDFDKHKGIHFNVKITSTEERYFVPILLPSHILTKTHPNKSEAESQVILRSLMMTIDVLKPVSNTPIIMPEKTAAFFLTNFTNSTEREYFQEMGSSLRDILKAAITTRMKQDRNSITPEVAGAFFIKATNDLFNYWSQDVKKHLDSLSKADSSVLHQINKASLDVLAGELKYIANEQNKKGARDIVLTKFAEFFNQNGNMELVLKIVCEHSKELGNYRTYANNIRGFMNLSPLSPAAESTQEGTRNSINLDKEEKKFSLSSVAQAFNLLRIPQAALRSGNLHSTPDVASSNPTTPTQTTVSSQSTAKASEVATSPSEDTNSTLTIRPNK